MIGHLWTRPAGVRVDGPPARGLWPPFGGGLCKRIVKGKVLKMDGPSAQGFLGLTAFQAEGCGLPLCGNAYEVSVTGLAVCVICDTISSATYFLVSP